jgi:hypothetical protein
MSGQGEVIGGPVESADGRRFYWVMTEGNHGVPTTVCEQYITDITNDIGRPIEPDLEDPF